ncbi:MAG: UDP-N-acetylmuramoyl-L-alanyl-D-glutamate--2,6-diaminopimelate ligase [Legionellales bacterium]|nr:UDP-N-acetylmuramoyl-L-alanyl-D-glutamate--2,6-diaminopimelate ligase [Legionellales bacterium]
MKLSELLRNVLPLPSHYDIEFQDLTSDSREVKQSDVFIALAGKNTQGKQHIEEAIAKGAVCVLCDAPENRILETQNSQQHIIPIIHICGLEKRLSQIAAHAYGYPSEKLTIIGITGTNGKSSCSHLIARALNQLNQKAVVIGTLGNGDPDNLQASQFTTPEPIQLQRLLAEYVKQQVKYVAMEVSSHGLALGRVENIHFPITVFTNLTRDHLDFHQTMEAYAQAKLMLFQRPHIHHAIINRDDPFSKKIKLELARGVNIIDYGLTENTAGLAVKNFQLSARGIEAEIIINNEIHVLKSPLLGRFNLYNLLAILGVLLSLNVTPSQALTVLPQLPTIPGRMQAIHAEGLPTAVVDYAHTPDALANALSTLADLKQAGKLWCVFGCGGDRDRGKRAPMAVIAEQYADHIVVTDDNPRQEDPQKIIKDICQGFRDMKKVTIKADRARAIHFAYTQAQPQDIVLIAGKGHENYQIIGQKRLPFSDVEVVQTLIKEVKDGIITKA